MKISKPCFCISAFHLQKTLQKMCTEFNIPYPKNASVCQLKELLKINFSELYPSLPNE